MSSAKVMLYEDFSLNDIKLSSVRKNQNNGKTIYINNTSGGSVLIQLPKMRVPFGLGVYEEAGKRPSYHISLSLSDSNVVSFFEKIDNYIIDYVAKNSEECLGKVMNETVIREALYTHMAKPANDSKYAPSLKVKILANSEGQFDEIYDTNENVFDLKELQRGQEVEVIVKLASIWIVGTKFGVSVRLESLMAHPQTKLKGFSFLKRAEEEPEDEDFEH